MTQKYQVKVSMKQAAIVETGIVLKQGDFGMQLEIEVLDFDATGTTPQIVFRKAMGAVESTTITVSGNKYTYTFKGTELDTPGKCFCDLKLKNSTTQRISTASFMFKVVADTMDGLTEESSSYSDTIAQIVGGFDDDISSLNFQVKKISEGDGLLGSTNLFDKTAISSGYLVEGQVTSIANHSYSDYIVVDPSKTYAFRGISKSNGTKVQIGLYDANKTWIADLTTDDVDLITSGTNYPFKFNFASIDYSFYYIRLNLLSSSADSYMFVEGSTYPSSYIAYQVKLKSDDLESYISEKIAAVTDPIENVVGGLTNDVENIQNLLTTYDRLHLNISYGYYTNTTGSSAIPTSNENYYCAKVSVTPGEIYRINGVVRKYAYGLTSLVVFIDEDDTQVIGNILPESDPDNDIIYTNYEFTIPAGAGYIGITSVKNRASLSYDAPSLYKKELASYDMTKKYQVTVTDDELTVNVKEKITYRFKKLAANSLYQLYSWTINDVTITHNTDMIGPFYNLNAVNNANGDRTTQPEWTGGCHGYNGDQTGTPTATMIERKIILDGAIQTANGIYSCDSVTLQFVNGIQGNNTCLEAGGGRVIMEETQSFTIEDGVIKVSVLLDPLEEIVVEKYYGMQLAGYNKYYLLSDKYYEIGNQGTKDIKPEIIVGYNSNSELSMKMEQIGLGDYHLNTTENKKVTSSSNKAYFIPIHSNTEHWMTGEKQYWIGEYALGRALNFGQ